jgi:glutamate N-acetyltransferase/amino-acid N-acetyltransferase
MSVTAAQCFVAAGVHCGLRKNGKPDLALVRSTMPSVGAALFTENRVQAAPVIVSRAHLEAAQPQAVVANSGNANAATGDAGIADAHATAAEAARLLGIEPEQVVVLSTGVIGQRLPVDRLLAGLSDAAAALGGEGDAAAEAIMTTDTRPKLAQVTGAGFTVGGIAKGSGMIHPQLATMLAVVTTDYPLEADEPPVFLRPAVEESFNSISVDGECSTNDAVVLLANGASEAPRDDVAFADALHTVCRDLAAQIVADGEGATVVAEIVVSGAASAAEAKAVARRIATSPLVKTALFGKDANWGRVLAAAGSAPFNGGFAHLDPGRVTLRYNGALVLERGALHDVEPDDIDAPTIELDLGLGDGTARYLTTDFSYDYVRINAEYRT